MRLSDRVSELRAAYTLLRSPFKGSKRALSTTGTCRSSVPITYLIFSLNPYDLDCSSVNMDQANQTMHQPSGCRPKKEGSIIECQCCTKIGSQGDLSSQSGVISVGAQKVPAPKQIKSQLTPAIPHHSIHG